METNTFPLPSAWTNSLARAGSVNGDQKRQEFTAALLDMFPETRFLYLPVATETTTSTDRSLEAATITYDADASARYSAVGSGLETDFDGTDDEADTPDANALSAGDSTTDAAVSFVVLCTPDVNNAAMTLLAKENSSSAEEYNFGLNSSGHLVLTLTDESATATLTGTFATGVGTSRTLLAATYDGSRAATGIRCYKDGTAQTTAAGGSGTYVAMENTAALLHLGARYTTKQQFFNGKIAFALMTFQEITAKEMWALKAVVNGYYGLSL